MLCPTPITPMTVMSKAVPKSTYSEYIEDGIKECANGNINIYMQKSFQTGIVMDPTKPL